MHDDRAKKALWYSLVDGVLWSVMFGFAENYIVPFVLLFGATAFHASLMQGMVQLSISAAQLLGGEVVYRLRKRRILSVVTVIIHASTFIIIPIAALLTKNYWLIIVTFAFGAFATNLGGPGWISWMNDIVPTRTRGAFWGMRHRIVNFAMFCAIIVAGVLYFFAEKNDFLIPVYIVLFTIAGLSRLSGTIPLWKMFEPQMAHAKESAQFKFRIFLTKLTTSNFGRFALFSFLLTFAVNTMAPVIPVFLFRSLKFDYLQYMIITLAPMVATFLSMSYWGRLADKYGNYRILLITAISIPLLSIGWAFIKDFAFLIPLQLFSGFVWSGFNLSNQNYMFDSVRPANMPKISAYFLSLNNLCAFIGSITGGVLTEVTRLFTISFFAESNFELIFLLSALLRIIIIVFLIKSFTEVRQVAPSPKIHHFYFSFPAASIYTRLVLSIKSFQRKKVEGK